MARVGPNTRFSNCLQGANLSWYDNLPPLDDATTISYVNEANFNSNTLHFPFITIAATPRTEAGVVLNVYGNLGVSGNEFNNMKYGIRAIESNNVSISSNEFSDLSVGTSLLDWGITPLTLDAEINENTYANNKCAIQASGAMLIIKEKTSTLARHHRDH